MTAQLKDLDEADAGKFERRTLVCRNGNAAKVLVTFPKAGRWGVELFTKSRDEQGMYWQAGVLEFEARSGTAWTFAQSYGSVATMDSCLENPLYVPLPANKAQEFKIRVHGAQRVQLRIGERTWIPMERAAGDADLYHVTATVPDAASVQIMAQPLRAGNTYWTLVNFSAQ